MNQSQVEVQNVTKRFGNVCAVNQISLSIAQGEFFSLLGPSGCGKTTLLRMIAGFEQESSGQILIDGRKMSGVPPHKRPVNMVFQSYALFPHLTVFDNVAFGLRANRSVSKEEIPQRVEWALNLVRLPGFGDRFPRQISGGQAQRVALARAMANHPSVLLLDEPLSALDLKIRQEMQEELARLQRELGITFVMVTHDQGEALALSDRMAVFCQGNLEQWGTPQEIYESPRTRFVADFIGQNNLLDGTVAQRTDKYSRIVLESNLSLWVKNHPEEPVSENSEVAIWIRTEAFSLSLAQQGDEPFNGGNEPVNKFIATVTHSSYQGTTTDYRLRINDHISLKASCRNESDTIFQPGQTVHVSLPATHASLLPGTESGDKAELSTAV